MHNLHIHGVCVQPATLWLPAAVHSPLHEPHTATLHWPPSLAALQALRVTLHRSAGVSQLGGTLLALPFVEAPHLHVK